MRKIALGLTALAAVASTPSFAATTGGTMDVKMDVTNVCNLTIGTIDFGSLSDFTTLPNTPVNSGTTLKCTPSAVAVVTVDNGLNVNGTQRRLKSTTLSTAAYINYNLVDGSGTAWPTTGLSFTGNGSANTINLRGQLPAQSSQPADSYSDKVTITVNY